MSRDRRPPAACIAALCAWAVVFAATDATAAGRDGRGKKAGETQQTKKPNPCASYGPGFTMLSGTTTCVRIGGAAVGDFGAGRGAAPNLGVK